MGPGRPARPSRRGRRGGTPDWLLANPRCTDANANVTQWSYDTEGRLTRKTHADASHYDYTHDAAGRLLTRTDAMSRTTAYTYSATGQLLAVDYPTDPDVSYTYDALGRRLAVTDATGTTTWTYDPATGQPATVTHTNVGAGSTPRLLSYTWDPAGRRLSTAVDGTTLATYTYDAQARMATVTSGSAGVPPASFTYSYLNASNQVTGIDMPGELAVARTYDALGRLASVTNAAGNTAISAFAYAYDQSDRRTRVDLVDGGRWEYSYDNTGQLTGGTRYGPKLDQQEGTLVQYAYQYDAMGNPTSRTEDAGVSAYTFNNLNQLVTGSWSGTLSAFGWAQTANLAGISVTANQQTQSATVFQKGEWTAKELTLPAGDTTLTVTRTANDQTTTQAQATVTRPTDATAYQHDLNGNLLGDGTWTYAWDEENRLVSAERAGAPASPRARLEFAYDAIGRRRALREYAWQDNVWVLAFERRYTWDGWLPVHEETSDYSTTPATTHVDVYVRGLDLSGSLEGAGGIGGMLALVHDGSLVCYLDNGRGDITELADPATGAAVAHYEYDPFGRQLIASGPVADLNRYRFSSKERDPTGLFYYGYRYYHPSQGRWASRDPASERAGLNLMAFCRNASPSAVDAVGLWWQNLAGSIWRAESDDDSLEDLAMLVSADARNWVCIWPVPDPVKWARYPRAKKCARADVDNLLRTSGPEARMLPSVAGDPFLQRSKAVMGWAYEWGAGPYDGVNAAIGIKAISGQGGNPIHRLYLAGHSGMGMAHLSRKNQVEAPFTAGMLSMVAEEPSNGNNTYPHASHRIGPPKCWFTRSAAVYGLGCHTSDAWAPDWANKVMRWGSSAFGTRNYLVADTWFGSPYWVMSTSAGGGWASRYGPNVYSIDDVTSLDLEAKAGTQ